MTQPMTDEQLDNVIIDSGHRDVRLLLTAYRHLRSRLAAAERALTKVSDIRDSIVGMQGFNFSEHAYPLVAALDEAGYQGKGYEISRANLGTLIEQTKAAEAERDAARAKLEEVTEMHNAQLPKAEWIFELHSLKDQLAALTTKLASVEAERDVAQSACSAAIEASSQAMFEMRAQLTTLTAQRDQAVGDEIEAIAALLEREADGWIDEDGKVAIRAVSLLVRAHRKGQ